MSAKSNTLRVRDMTVGDPIRLILSFAVPLFIGNIFQQVYNMVDTMLVFLMSVYMVKRRELFKDSSD